MERENLFVNTFRQVYRNLKGRPVRTVGSPAGSDSRIWKNIAGCPTIQFGPGRLEQCHSPNEYVELQAYLDCILLYAQMILAWGAERR